MAFITLLSLLSFNAYEGTKLIRIPHADKIAHFCFYFGAGFLAGLTLRERYNATLSETKGLLLAFLFAVIYGIIIEVLQYSLDTGRDGNLWDALANSFGALGGFLLLKLLFSMKNGLKWNT